MILPQELEVTLQPNVMPHYKIIGYDVGWRKKIKVPWGHLPQSSGLKVVVMCDYCPNIFKRVFHKTIKSQIHLCTTCSKKKTGAFLAANPTENLKKYREKLRTQLGPASHVWNPNRPEFKRYSSKVHNESDRVYKKHINEINPNSHPRTLCGVVGGYQLDHKFAVKDAFLSGWTVEQCSAKENLQMLPWLENNLKAKKNIA